MRNTRMMIRFLDLTLLLLMAFLLQADLAIERAVGLPHGEGPSTVAASDGFTVNLTAQSWAMTGPRGRVCGGPGVLGLRDCIAERASGGTTVLIAPNQSVRVQRLVDALDICSSTEATCSVRAST